MSEDDARRIETILAVGAEGGSTMLDGQRNAAGGGPVRVATNESVPRIFPAKNRAPFHRGSPGKRRWRD